MTFYHLGETYKVQTKVYDSNGDLIDPSSIACSIINPTGSVISSGSMAKISTGIYLYSYDIPASAVLGSWESKITVGDAVPSTEIESERFYVVDRIYTTPQQISSLLRLVDPVTGGRLIFTNDTDPSLSEVEKLIMSAMASVDKITNHAWRAVQVIDEYYDIIIPVSGFRRRDLPLKLKHRQINSFESGIDKIEIWDGTDWIDLILDSNGYTEGRGTDYWIDYERGMIYFVNEKPYYADKGVRVSYRYGDSSVPGDIEEAATKLAAVNLLETNDYVVTLPEGVNSYELESKANTWKRDVRRILADHKEIISI